MIQILQMVSMLIIHVFDALLLSISAIIGR